MTTYNFSSKKFIIRTVLALLISMVVVFLILTTIAKDRVAGEALYGFKTTVAEPVFRATKLTTTSRVAYDTTLLEARLTELNTLAADTSTSSADVLWTLANLSDHHVTTALSTLSSARSLSSEDKIMSLANLNNVIRAEETLGDAVAEFEPITEALAQSEGKVREALRAAITEFVANNATDTVQTFLATQIATVSAAVVAIAPGSQAQHTIMRRISDTEDAVVDQNFAEAITAILRAEQAIAVDGYLWDAERGPLDGVPIEPGPIPAGN